MEMPFSKDTLRFLLNEHRLSDDFSVVGRREFIANTWCNNRESMLTKI